MIFLGIAFSCVMVFAWINTDFGAGYIVFAVFYGFFTGVVVALPAIVLTSFTTDFCLGTGLGMPSTLNGGASLIGTPIAGGILNAT